MGTDRIADARRWIETAQADYVAAAESSDPYTICFHAQQWVEKVAKAVLALHGAEIPHNHNMAFLLARCEQLEASLTGFSRYAPLLQPFAVAIRYENTKEQATAQCAQVWAAAREVCAAVNEVINRSTPIFG